MTHVVKKHFVTFYSPGTLVPETTTRSIESWDVDIAVAMAGRIQERYYARPFAFRFTTRARTDDELNSKEVEHSARYYLGGRILTLADVEARADPRDRILIINMRGNGIERVVENTNSYRSALVLEEGDIVLDVTLPPLLPEHD